MEAGMSSFWVSGKQPCLIIADSVYITIFVTQCNAPAYAQRYEVLRNIFLGACTRTESASSERRGIDLGSCDRLYSAVELNANYDKEIRTACVFGQSDGIKILLHLVSAP